MVKAQVPASELRSGRDSWLDFEMRTPVFHPDLVIGPMFEQALAVLGAEFLK